MGKAGLAASGLSKVQRYRCNHCGKTTVKLSTETSSNNHHHNRHIIDFTDLEEAQIQVRSIKASMTIEQYLKTLRAWKEKNKEKIRVQHLANYQRHKERYKRGML